MMRRTTVVSTHRMSLEGVTQLPIACSERRKNPAKGTSGVHWAGRFRLPPTSAITLQKSRKTMWLGGRDSNSEQGLFLTR